MIKRILYWSPRLLSILVILFMLLMSADCFEGNTSFRDKGICLIMHNIPTLIVILVLWASWIKELTGGILHLLLALAAAVMFNSFTGNPGSLIVVIPLLLSGILFILGSWYMRHPAPAPEE